MQISVEALGLCTRACAVQVWLVGGLFALNAAQIVTVSAGKVKWLLLWSCLLELLSFLVGHLAASSRLRPFPPRARRHEYYIIRDHRVLYT